MVGVGFEQLGFDGWVGLMRFATVTIIKSRTLVHDVEVLHLTAVVITVGMNWYQHCITNNE